jgi:hypothetical protein
MVIDDFPIIEKELDSDDEDSILGDINDGESFNHKINSEKNPNYTFNNKKKNSISHMNGNNLMYSSEMPSNHGSKYTYLNGGKEHGRREYFGHKQFKDRDYILNGNHTFLVEEGSNLIIK